MPGFSAFFTELMERSPVAESFFDVSEADLSNPSFYEAREKPGSYDRAALKRVITATMSGLALSGAQEDNIGLLGAESTFAVVTGQQVGFLGGPLYTYLKSATAVFCAEKLSSRQFGRHFVPIIWVEDNDHDAPEAAEAYLADSMYELGKLSACEYTDAGPGRPVSELRFDSRVEELGRHAGVILQSREHRQEAIELIQNTCAPGMLWRDSFIRVLNYLLGGSGLLFLSASIAREHGLFDSIAGRELSEPGVTSALVDTMNSKLCAAGFHLQARAFSINLFAHEDGRRINIKDYGEGSYLAGKELLTQAELLARFSGRQGVLSPKVLLRPVMQDSIVPTAAYVAGPSEAAYLAQAGPIYRHFGVHPPAIVPRVSLTLLDRRTERFMVSEGIGLNYFLRDIGELERELTGEIRNDSLDELFAGSAASLESIYGRIAEAASEAEPSLERSAATMLHKSLDLLAVMKKKIISAEKKQNESHFEMYRRASSFLYPLGTLQERVLPAIWFVAAFGSDAMLRAARAAFGEGTDCHVVLGPSDIEIPE